MKRILFFITSGTLMNAFAIPIESINQSTVITPQGSYAQMESLNKQTALEASNDVAGTFSMSRTQNLVNPVRTVGNGSLVIKEYMTNRDIGLSLENTTQAPIILQRISIIIDNQECAAVNNLNIKINGKQSKSGFWYPRNLELLCQQVITNHLPMSGTYNLVDISSMISPVKYQSYISGSFIYPAKLSITYSSNNILTTTYKDTYYVNAKL